MGRDEVTTANTKEHRDMNAMTPDGVLVIGLVLGLLVGTVISLAIRMKK